MKNPDRYNTNWPNKRNSSENQRLLRLLCGRCPSRFVFMNKCNNNVVKMVADNIQHMCDPNDSIAWEYYYITKTKYDVLFLSLYSCKDKMLYCTETDLEENYDFGRLLGPPHSPLYIKCRNCPNNECNLYFYTYENSEGYFRTLFIFY